MQPPELIGRTIRFGHFELDIDEGKLSKAGHRIRLQAQPLQILLLLLERPGHVVTREEMRQKLWSGETFVEFDDALNTAIRKLRAALGEAADNPRFLETVPRRGYRFIAPVTIPPPSEAIEKLIQPTPPRMENFETVAVSNPMPPVSALPVLRRSRWPRLAMIALGCVLIAVAAGGYWRYRKHVFRITPKDTIIVADFVNTTGQPVFDDALRQGLEIGLEQSPYVAVLADRKSSVIMKQMGRSPEERITGRTALEVCQRAGGKVMVQGSIASLGRSYLIGLAAIRCDTGDPVANEQSQAKREEDVLDALGHTTALLRSRLGESLPSIRKYNAPLEQATTTSLEALNTYGLALSTWDRKGNRESLPLFKRATELDPNFAQAYGGLATVYHNLGYAALARESASKAYELRNQVTLAEKASIEARYYSYVTGDLEKAFEVRALAAHDYSDSPGSYYHLADAYDNLGRYADAVQNLRKGLLLDPTRANGYADLATALLGLNELEQAAAVLAEASKRHLLTDDLLQANYRVAFLRNDQPAMQNLLQQSATAPGAEAQLLIEQADSEAYRGRFEKALDLSLTAVDLMKREGDNDSAALTLAQTALWEIEIGDVTHARTNLSEARRLSAGEGLTTLTALCMAKMGNLRQAQRLSLELSKAWPSGTYIQKYWLPLIRAEIDIHSGQVSRAVEELSGVISPLELAAPFALPVATLYPAYVRGQAYLAMGDGAAASHEFQKFADHRNLVANYPLYPLARLGLARSYAMAGESAKARTVYEEFFEVWKDADRSNSTLQKAHLEYIRLR